MAWTFDTLKSSMGDHLGIPSTDTRRLPDSVRDYIINVRHKEIARRINLRTGSDTETYTTAAAGEYAFSLPGDFGAVSNVTHYSSADAESIVLEGITMTEYDRKYLDLTDSDNWGDPLEWTIDGAYLKIGPPSDAVGDIIALKYWTIPVDLTGATQTSDITRICGDALFYLCLADAAMYILEEMRVPGFEKRGYELLDEYISQDARRIYEGRRPISKEP